MEVKLHILVVDKKIESNVPGIDYISLDEIKRAFPDDYKKIQHYEQNTDTILRWALKPLLAKYLLQEKELERLIFLDPDLYFFNDPSFLFEELKEKAFLLSPHWRSRDPFKDSRNFEELFTGGIFNGGFFGCNADSIEILDWWLDACAYKMVKENGLYVDQGYLTLLPVYFPEKTGIIHHKGCNVSSWNMIECDRSLQGDELILAGEYPLIFVHFTGGTIFSILSSYDPLLKPHLEEYENAIKRYVPNFEFTIDETLLPKKRYKRFFR